MATQCYGTMTSLFDGKPTPSVNGLVQVALAPPFIERFSRLGLN
jgi:hypothetical protein